MASTLARKIVPFADRVLVKRVIPQAKTASGILLPDSGQKRVNEGVVLAVGPGLLKKDGTRTTLNAKVGDKVLLPEYGGNKVDLGDAPAAKKATEESELLLFRDEDILGRLE